MSRRFQNRIEAGKLLAVRLHKYANRPDVIVLALPRGGVPVAFEVARELNAPLDVYVVRKLGVPGHRELAMGAIATGGIRIINERVVEELGIPQAVIDRVAVEEKQELERRETVYRGHSDAPHLAGRVVILVDDGIATGSTMRAAIAAIRREHPARIVVAVPVASAASVSQFEGAVDEIIALMAPEEFYAVAQFYDDFGETIDAEVTLLLREARRWPGLPQAGRQPAPIL